MTQLRMQLLAPVLVLLAIFSLAPGKAEVPSLMSYQGRLVGDGGQPAADGEYQVTFAIYPTEANGDALWAETRTVAVSGGLFSLFLGANTPLPPTAFTGQSWLQITVGNTTLTPRQRMVSVGYALRSALAESVPDGSITTWKINTFGARAGDVLVFNGGNATWAQDGLTLPFAKRASSGSSLLELTNTGLGNAALFTVENAANDLHAVMARSNGTSSTIYSIATGTGDALYANSENGTSGKFFTYNEQNTNAALYALHYGRGNAIYGNAQGSGTAIKGYTSGTGKAGYFSINRVDNASDALYVSTNGSGRALYSTTSGSGAAVMGYTTGTGSAADFRVSHAGSPAHAVFVSTTADGDAVHAYTTGDGSALHGYSTGTGHAGYFATTLSWSDAATLYAFTCGRGPTISALNTGTWRAGEFVIDNEESTAVALYAATNGTGMAGYFGGDVEVSGTLHVGPQFTSVPYTYAYIDYDGPRTAGTPNFTSTWNAAQKRYEITFTGVTYSLRDFVTVVTPSEGEGILIPQVGCVNGKLTVKLYNLQGQSVQSDFQFVTFRPGW